MKFSGLKTAMLCLTVLLSANLFAQTYKDSPSWVKDLVVYEIPIRSYTSPNGPETGTFSSLKEKASYLGELGVNSIWLSGHSWGDAKHFYNIWTQYACIRPDVLDPALGTPEEFKAMVDEFHKNGVRVFLDIITHGVMSYSPLVYEKPRWFKGSTWGMADYDWFGGHKDLDDWWVDTHTRYVTEYGVDGFRLDVEIYRPDLWWRIKQNAFDAGHPIAVFNEHGALTDNVADFYQLSTSLYNIYDTKSVDTTVKLLYDAAAQYRDFVKPQNAFGVHSVRVFYTDGTDALGMPDGSEGALRFSIERESEAEGAPLNVRITGIDKDKSIKSIAVYASKYHKAFAFDGLKDLNYFPLAITGLSEVTVRFDPFVFDRVYHTVQLTSHDRGWETFTPSGNPYFAQGSRCVMGYSCLFAPAIPIFMGGEEFDADFVPLPTLSYYLYKKEMIGKGTWLYGSWIQWDQLKEKRHADMLSDTRRMLAIRKQESDLICAAMNDTIPDIARVEFTASPRADVPVPYVLWNDHKAVVVAGNNTDQDLTLTLNVPLEKIGMAGVQRIAVTDLWNGWTKTVCPSELAAFAVKIKKDKTAGGGLSVLKLEAE